MVALAAFARAPANFVAMVILGFLILVAIYAPLLANETAWFWSDAKGWQVPAFNELFNRFVYTKRYDLLFNLLAVLVPPWVVLWALLRRRVGTVAVLKYGAIAVAVIWVACQIPIPAMGGTGNGPWRAIWDERAPTTCTYGVLHQGGPAVAGVHALFPPVPHRYDATYAGAVLQPPGTVNPATGARFWLGTDEGGHDLLAQMLFGARISLTIGFLATAISITIGTIIGVVAGYCGGMVDLLLSRFIEIMMCFPTFILVLVVMAMIGRDIMYTMLVIGLTGWAGTARLMRGEVLGQAVRDYVLAAESLGLSPLRVMFRHILPNALAPLMITATFSVAGAVMIESALSFLGMGDPATASWGQLLNQGDRNLDDAWLIYTPGLAVFLLLTVLNTIGSGLTEALDPKAVK